jgi:hypothetical protein
MLIWALENYNSKDEKRQKAARELVKIVEDCFGVGSMVTPGTNPTDAKHLQTYELEGAFEGLAHPHQMSNYGKKGGKAEFMGAISFVLIWSFR